MIFSFFCVIVLGVLGYFSIAIAENSEKNARTVSVEYEIIEDNG